MPAMPKPDASALYNWPTSIASAEALVLKGLLASASANTTKAIGDLFDSQVKAQQANVSSDIIDRSKTFGESIGNAILDWADKDGYLATRNLTYTPPTGLGLWVPTPPAFKPALEPYWGQLRPFALYSADTCVPPAPMEYSTANTSTLYQQALCVYDTYNNLTDEQKAIANFWADNTGVSYTPPGHWLSIENLMVKQLSLGIGKAVEMYALVGVTMADAFISCWHAKFQYCTERPVTYINQNIDPKWAPIIATPPFPEYTLAIRLCPARYLRF